MSLPTPENFAPIPGQPLTLGPELRVIVAPNASPMTERGTNTYLLGTTDVTIVDPGPHDARHLAAIHAALAPDARIARILVTHSHLDHSPAAAPLAAATGAPVLAFGPSGAGRSARMADLDLSDLGGGEGIDADFQPTQRLAHGQQIDTPSGPVTALHTPGHLGNHLCFRWRDMVFSGDHLMGWAPSLVSPPDGDLTDFMASLGVIEALGPLPLLPGHGAPVANGATRAQEIRNHRLKREAAILHALSQGAPNAIGVTQQVYRDVPDALLPAALRNVLAHVIDLQARDLVRFSGSPSAKTALELIASDRA